jgi:predicted ATPase
VLASALASEGRASEAFALVGEAFSRVHSHEERWWEPELYRVLGELLAQQGADGVLLFSPATAECAHDPEACFVRALELARQNRARSFELRAALSLAKLWQARGNTQPARALLAESYGWFSEGFATSDLRRARELLTELGEPA